MKAITGLVLFAPSALAIWHDCSQKYTPTSAYGTQSWRPYGSRGVQGGAGSGYSTQDAGLINVLNGGILSNRNSGNTGASRGTQSVDVLSDLDILNIGNDRNANQYGYYNYIGRRGANSDGLNVLSHDDILNIGNDQSDYQWGPWNANYY